jgi:iron complex outermembrane receptor protein
VTVQRSVITDNPQAVSSVGHHPQGVPAHMANLWTTYDFSIGAIAGFQVGAGLNYRDRTFSDLTNANSVPSFVIASAALSYETTRWGVDLDVRNIADKHYFIAANAAGGFVGESRSAFVNLRLKY